MPWRRSSDLGLGVAAGWPCGEFRAVIRFIPAAMIQSRLMLVVSPVVLISLMSIRINKISSRIKYRYLCSTMQTSPKPVQPLLQSLDGLFDRRFAQNFLPIPATNQLPIGAVAPPVQLLNINTRQLVELTDYAGQILLLAFTRIFTEKHYCPFCFPHLLELNNAYEQFRQRGVEVLLITSTDLVQSQIVQQDLGLKMPLFSDPNCRAFRAYQTGQALGAPLPAQFLLDANGRIQFRHLFSFIEPNANVERLLNVIDTAVLTKSQ
jgi:peroxiredoxin